MLARGGGALGESTVAAGDDVLRAYQLCVALYALGDQLRVLDMRIAY
jgi:hypothetical protein